MAKIKISVSWVSRYLERLVNQAKLVHTVSDRRKWFSSRVWEIQQFLCLSTSVSTQNFLPKALVYMTFDTIMWTTPAKKSYILRKITSLMRELRPIVPVAQFLFRNIYHTSHGTRKKKKKKIESKMTASFTLSFLHCLLSSDSPFSIYCCQFFLVFAFHDFLKYLYVNYWTLM